MSEGFLSARKEVAGLLLGIRRRALLDQLLFHLAPSEYEIVVVAIGAPRTWRHIAHLYKLPVGNVGRLQSKIVTNSRRDVQPGAMV